MKIDMFNHFLPLPYLDALKKHAGQHPGVRFAATVRPLWDLDERLKIIEEWPDLQQVVALALPVPEVVVGPDLTPELARIANDGMAEIRDRRPDKFPAFVASLPMNNIPAAIEEMDRAIEKCGACGIQVLTSVGGKALDAPDLFPIFERITNRYGLPIWLHPFKSSTIADYPVEKESDYDISLVLSWPHETSVAMARMVFSQMFDKLPKCRVITHHCGGTIPFLAGRAGPLWDQLGQLESGVTNPRHKTIFDQMAEKGLRPVDYFKKFYGDTVLGGATTALRCGLDFFGTGHVVFATDCPFGPESGMAFLRDNIRSVEEVGLSDADRDDVYFGNALKLLRRAPA